MADNYVRINTASLTEDADSIKASLGRILLAVDDMYDQVDALNNMWKGTANSAFRNQFGKDYQEIKRFISDVKKFVDRLSNDSKSYENCEKSVIDIAENIRI